MPWRRLWQLGAASAAVLLIGVAAVAAPGSVELRNRAGGPPGSWLARCGREQPRADRLLLRRCSRITGRVLAVRHTGAGASRETHLLLAARLHLFVVKLRPTIATPRIGAYATVEGALVRARDGLREVDAWAARA